MIVWIGFIIPLIATILLVVFFRERTRIIEIVVLWILSIGIIFIAKIMAERIDATEVEYWGEYGVKVEYYEEWDEWVHQTCTSTDSEGNVTTYDCSYRRYHGPEWYVVTNLNNNYSIPEKKYKEMLYTWDNKRFVDLNRDYHNIDGNKYESYWDKKDYNIFPVITTHYYQNKVANSSSIYEFPEVDTSKHKVFEYPEVENYNCNSILSEVKSEDIYWADKLLTNYNAQYGAQKQVRMWILIFKDKPFTYAMHQENYWKRGNKNEITLCIGVRGGSLKVDWVKCFSWTDEEMLKVRLEDFVRFQKKLDIYKTVNTMKDEVVTSFVRKPFEEFDYLEVEPSLTITIIALIFILLSVGGITVYIIFNEFDNNEKVYNTLGSRRKNTMFYSSSNVKGGNKWNKR